MQQPDFMDEDYRLAKLFDTVKDFVLASGGDGEGWIVSPRYRVLADKLWMSGLQSGGSQVTRSALATSRK